MSSGSATDFISPEPPGGGAGGTRKSLGAPPTTRPRPPARPAPAAQQAVDRVAGRWASCCRVLGDWCQSPQAEPRLPWAARAGPCRDALCLRPPGPEEGTGGVESLGDFPFPLPCCPSGHRNARLTAHLSLLSLSSSVPCPQPSAQPPGSPAVLRPDLRGPGVRASRAASTYPVRLAGRTRSFSAPPPAFCGGAGAGTRAEPEPARPASRPWPRTEGRSAGDSDRASTDVSLKEPP